MGVTEWETAGGSREGKSRQQGNRRDGYMSHIIDWQPCCAYCGNQFPCKQERPGTSPGAFTEFHCKGQQLLCVL